VSIFTDDEILAIFAGILDFWRVRMKLKALVGSGDKVMGLTLPFLLAGVAANVVWPAAFRLGFGAGGIVAAAALLVTGVPLWLTAVVQVLVLVPQKRLISTGPFALMLHPIFTAVALLVMPGLGLLLDSWVGFAIGAVLYVSTRIFAPAEEKLLERYFPVDYPAYRAKVLLPWL
jgi:protein-S-isoprenylcysteine O-methyltransferase Ste14